MPPTTVAGSHHRHPVQSNLTAPPCSPPAQLRSLPPPEATPALRSPAWHRHEPVAGTAVTTLRQVRHIATPGATAPALQPAPLPTPTPAHTIQAPTPTCGLLAAHLATYSQCDHLLHQLGVHSRRSPPAPSSQHRHARSSTGVTAVGTRTQGQLLQTQKAGMGELTKTPPHAFTDDEDDEF